MAEGIKHQSKSYGRGHNPIQKTMQNQWPEKNDNNQEPLSAVGTSIPVLYYKVSDFNYNQSFIQ
jgi:hypothetical protein